MKKWDKYAIINAIEAHHWDHEPELSPPGIDFINDDTVTMIKFAASNSIYANKVVRQRFDKPDEQIMDVINYYGDVPFSWWVGPNSKPHDLKARLENRGYVTFDVYVGLAYHLQNWNPQRMRENYTFVEVSTDEELWQQVKVSAAIWGYDEASLEAIFRQRKDYLKSPYRKGGFVVVLDGDKGVGYSNYRYSQDGTVLYLNGSAVLPDYRGKGIYKDLVELRLADAKAKGVELITCQAREGTSEPILRKLGFKEYGVYHHLSKQQKG